MALESPNPDDIEPSTVILRGQDELEYDYTPSDPNGSEIIPGMLIEDSAAGVVPHGTAAGETAPRFAVEDRKFGMFAQSPNAADDYDSYSPGDTVWEAHFDKGHWVYALLATGNSVDPPADVENRVVSDGAGGFRVFDGVGGDSESAIIGEAVRDPVDNSGGTDYARFKLRVY